MRHPTRRSRATWAALAAAALCIPAFTAVAGGAQADTTDPLREAQWHLDRVSAEPSWETSTGEGSVVAVVDSGVDLDHPDLAGRLVPGITTINCGEGQTTCGDGDWVGEDGEAQDPDIHGTHVAGIIAAAADNGVGGTGVAPGAKVMPVKSLEDGTGTTADIATGIRWAVDHGADVINMSLGGLPGTELLTVIGLDQAWIDAVDYAQEHGVTVVAAAGNSTYPFCSSPANIGGVICVTSTGPNDLPAYYSNLGFTLDPTDLVGSTTVAAPGGSGLGGCEQDVLSTVPVGTGEADCASADYDALAGTSMASPVVAGLAAQLHAQCRTSENVTAAITETAQVPLFARNLPTSPWYGRGLVDAERAVNHAGAEC